MNDKRDCFKGTVLRETPKAWQFIHDMDPVGDKHWLPKSECDWDEARNEMWVPVWLAREKGL
jgi:hypothetical protein